jgi:hypothetical protein
MFLRECAWTCAEIFVNRDDGVLCKPKRGDTNEKGFHVDAAEVLLFVCHNDARSRVIGAPVRT